MTWCNRHSTVTVKTCALESGLKLPASPRHDPNFAVSTIDDNVQSLWAVCVFGRDSVINCMSLMPVYGGVSVIYANILLSSHCCPAMQSRACAGAVA